MEEPTLKTPDAIPVARDGVHIFELALVVYQLADNTRVNTSV